MTAQYGLSHSLNVFIFLSKEKNVQRITMCPHGYEKNVFFIYRFLIYLIFDCHLLQIYFIQNSDFLIHNCRWHGCYAMYQRYQHAHINSINSNLCLTFEKSETHSSVNRYHSIFHSLVWSNKICFMFFLNHLSMYLLIYLSQSCSIQHLSVVEPRSLLNSFAGASW